jgi:hypothetical protein
MKWWLSQVPPDAEALVVENSAIAPEFQAAVARWVRPTLVVLTSLRPDHREVWGPGQEGAARALFPGIAPGVPVACGAGLARETLLRFFSANRNEAHFAPEFEGEAEVPFSHRESNLALALLAGSLCGLDPARIRPAMASLAPDLADFRILKDGGDELATAFSANDPESTRRLFAETGWDFAGTTILYHHRPDRLARLRDFLPWIRGNPWKDAVFTRQDRFFMQADIPPGIWPGPRIVWSAMDPLSFPAWRRGRGRVFACGNVAGWPLEFLRRESRREAGTAWV